MTHVTQRLVTDFAYQLAKSNPFRVVLDSTVDERLSQILSMDPVTKWSDSNKMAQAVMKTKSANVHPFFAVFRFKDSPNIKHVADVHVKTKIRETGFMLAELIQAPNGYDSDKAKAFQVDISLSDSEEYVADNLGIATDDNNFIDALVMGRAIFSWIDWNRITPQEYKDGLTILRETESSLPVGEYVFKVNVYALIHEQYRIDTDYIIDGITDYNQWELIQTEAVPKLGIGNPVTITVALSKSSSHGKNGSVETGSKGKKDKQVKEQDTPGPQLGA